MPAQKKDKTWGLIDAKVVRADGTALVDHSGHSLRTGFGNTISPLNGSSLIVISNGFAADAKQQLPARTAALRTEQRELRVQPAEHGEHQQLQRSAVREGLARHRESSAQGRWTAPARTELRTDSNPNSANDSVMLVLTIRAPTNARAFSFNSFFFSAEYPDFVCSAFNDQFIALVDTPNGTPQPIPNPVDKNLMTFTQNNQKWPVAINIASGTSVFSVCDQASMTQQCNGTQVSNLSCKLGAGALAGTGFEKPNNSNCIIAAARTG